MRPERSSKFPSPSDRDTGYSCTENENEILRKSNKKKVLSVQSYVEIFYGLDHWL